MYLSLPPEMYSFPDEAGHYFILWFIYCVQVGETVHLVRRTLAGPLYYARIIYKFGTAGGIKIGKEDQISYLSTRIKPVSVQLRIP
jgi:hypothetical protein